MALRYLRLAGRVVSGAHVQPGRHYHAVPDTSHRALCGIMPERGSGGWLDREGTAVTCPKCLHILDRGAKTLAAKL